MTTSSPKQRRCHASGDSSGNYNNNNNNNNNHTSASSSSCSSPTATSPTLLSMTPTSSRNSSSSSSSSNSSSSLSLNSDESPTHEVVMRTKKATAATHQSFRWDSLISWEIPPSQISVDRTRNIGYGTFGIVHQGIDVLHGVVAIKYLNVAEPTAEQTRAFKNEVDILKWARHDNILFFVGCILESPLAIVTEWCPGSSLYRYLHVDDDYREMSELLDIAKQVATGMKYLHAVDILHRDLKSNNIFLIPEESKSRWRVKIGDFGLAKFRSAWNNNNNSNTTSNNTTSPTPAAPNGSILWMAPEVIKQKVSDPYTKASDVYSYGVVLYELVTGQLPFLAKEPNIVLFLVGSGRLRLNADNARQDTPDPIKALIVDCTHYERSMRCDFAHVMQEFALLQRHDIAYYRSCSSSSSGSSCGASGGGGGIGGGGGGGGGYSSNNEDEDDDHDDDDHDDAEHKGDDSMDSTR